MGRAKCGNCLYCIKPKNGNLLCSLVQKPTNNDGCCYQYDESVGALFLKVIAVICGIMAALTLVGVYAQSYGC